MTTRFVLSTAAMLALSLLLATCIAENDSAEIAKQVTEPPAMNLPDLGQAPEIKNEVWLNTDHPLPLSSLRGQVVLIEFWTFG